MNENKTKLSKESIDEFLAKNTGWKIVNNKLERIFQFKNFKAINQFLPQLVAIIVEQNHHPDFFLKTDTKEIFLSTITHSVGGITEADQLLATTLENYFQASS